jgi:tRNA pseudouridine65 synthase
MIEILFQDEHYLIVNKPSGLLVHPYKKETNERDNLMKRVKEQTGLYLYPIHRLDRPASGILLFALSSEAGRKIQEIWHSDKVIKEYTALVRGQVESEGEMNFALTDPDTGKKKEAHTTYKLEKQFFKTALVKARIQTGRFHQIRRHFARRCHGLIGDTAHGKGRINQYFRDEFDLNRLFLHASYLKFTHPFSEETIEIHCHLPDELAKVLQKLN